MGVELSLDPPVCPIQANGGVSTHKIINHCDKMLAYKVWNPHFIKSIEFSDKIFQ